MVEKENKRKYKSQGEVGDEEDFFNIESAKLCASLKENLLLIAL